MVADGAGGLPAGKRASMTAVNTLAESLQVAMDKTTLLRTAILNGIDAANDAVLGLANGSATTMTVMTLEGRSGAVLPGWRLGGDRDRATWIGQAADHRTLTDGFCR